jgi:Tfp pilus assembly PilM family ATPase
MEANKKSYLQRIRGDEVVIRRNAQFYESTYSTVVMDRTILEGGKACCIFGTEQYASFDTLYKVKKH